MDPTPMAPDAHLDAFAREAAAFAAAARRGTDVPVPACPGMSLGELTVHLGVVHRRAAKAVRTGADEPVRAERQWFVDPTDPGLVAWFEEGAAEALDVCRAAGPQAPAWHFLDGGTASVWFRRLAHETAVHRWDAEQAHGEARPLDGDLAADGIDELLVALLPRVIWRQGPPEGAEPAGERFHFHRTDGPGEWLVVFRPEGVEVTTEHAKGDVAVRGPASPLLLHLWGRSPVDGLEVLGDAAVAARWPALAPAP